VTPLLQREACLQAAAAAAYVRAGLFLISVSCNDSEHMNLRRIIHASMLVRLAQNPVASTCDLSCCASGEIVAVGATHHTAAPVHQSWGAHRQHLGPAETATRHAMESAATAAAAHECACGGSKTAVACVFGILCGPKM
jgi:hypothetical protein